MRYFARKLPAAFAFAALLSGCGNGADDTWADYHQQLETALEASPIEREAPDNIGAFPARQTRLLKVSEVREGMLNVYALRECDITSLVAARNNQLGRVAPPSQQWLYERTLWQRLERCLHGEASKALSENDYARLEQLTELKTSQLPAVGWNALFDSEEWEKSFARSSQPLNVAALPELGAPLEAMNYLQEMVEKTFSTVWQADSASLENHLKTLQQRPLTAEILRTLMLASQRLDEANRLLADHTDSSHCLPAWQNAWLEPFEQTSQRWLAAINALIDVHEVSPPKAVADYQRQWLSLETPDAPWSRFQSTLQEHRVLRTAYPSCDA